MKRRRIGTIIHGPDTLAIVGVGPQARLVLDNGTNPSLIAKVSPWAVDYYPRDLTIDVPVQLRSPLTISVKTQYRIIMLKALTELGGARAITKTGGGELYYAPDTDGFTGTMTVEEGPLSLARENGPAILGGLVVGDDAHTHSADRCSHTARRLHDVAGSAQPVGPRRPAVAGCRLRGHPEGTTNFRHLFGRHLATSC